MMLSVYNRYKNRNFWLKLLKKGKDSLKAMSRNRFENNRIAKYQIEKYNRNKTKKLKNLKELEVQRLCEKMLVSLKENNLSKGIDEEEATQPLSQIEIDSDNSFEESSESYQPNNFEQLLNHLDILKDKVLVKNLKYCLEFLNGGKLDQKNKDGLIDLFLEIAPKFIDNPKEFLVEITKVSPREKIITASEIIKEKFDKWVLNDQVLSIFKDKLDDILKSSTNTLSSFVEAKNKWEFVKCLNQKYGKKILKRHLDK